MSGLLSDPAALFHLVLVALGGYLLGGVNGSIVTSAVFQHDDVRKHGSGNAGLTNYYRNYGAKRIALVLLIDIGKTVLAVLLGALFFPNAFGRYFGALFCQLGHMFPVYYRFKGGKGVLCSGVAVIMIDWRVALVGGGTFFLLLAATRYVSLGSVVGMLTVPVVTWLVYRGEPDAAYIVALPVIMAALVIWAHRGNIARLLNGTESRFTLHKEKGDKA